MRRTGVCAGALVSLWAISNILAADRPSFTYTEITVPGAVSASAQGINAGGDIVGFYRTSAGATRGFYWRGGEVTTIHYPSGAAHTDARGIGPDGTVVGTYAMPGEPSVNAHGYVLKHDGSFTNVDYPGHTNNILQRILPDGTILGCRHDHDTMTTMRGIVISPDGGTSETDTFASMHNGATPDGRRIVGFFMNMMTGRTESYLIQDGQFSEFIVPGSNLTTAWDMNARGEIVGAYRDAANRIHGFVRTGQDYASLDFPGAVTTRAFGVNAGGDVVGAFVDSTGRTRAFMATRKYAE